AGLPRTVSRGKLHTIQGASHDIRIRRLPTSAAKLHSYNTGGQTRRKITRHKAYIYIYHITTPVTARARASRDARHRVRHHLPPRRRLRRARLPRGAHGGAGDP